jgi:PAS domain S-box-containing protein
MRVADGDRSGSGEARSTWLLQAVDQAADFIFLIDERDCFAYANRRALDLLGIPPAKLLGQPAIAVVAQEDHAPLLDALHAARRGDSAPGPPIECRFVPRHVPEPVAFEITLRSVTVGGRDVGCVGIARSIPQRRDSLAQRLASERVAAIGDLANRAADRINNPLAVLVTHVGNIERAAAQGKPADDASTQQMRTAVARIADVTEELATIADTSIQKLLLGRPIMDLGTPPGPASDETPPS